MQRFYFLRYMHAPIEKSICSKIIYNWTFYSTSKALSGKYSGWVARRSKAFMLIFQTVLHMSMV